MRYYIIAGEASGDLHGAGLMKALKAQDKNAEFRFWGGDLNGRSRWGAGAAHSRYGIYGVCGSAEKFKDDFRVY